jgi:hypothetical protein
LGQIFGFSHSYYSTLSLQSPTPAPTRKPNLVFTGVAAPRPPTAWYQHWNGVGLIAGPDAQQSTIRPGEVLRGDAAVSSASGRYTLTYQADGNLVVYRNPERSGLDRTALWATHTMSSTLGATVMQPDGNLVVFDRLNRPVYSSRTGGNPGARLIVQDDGNVVIYRADGRAIWATDTVQVTSDPTAPSSRTYYRIETFAGKVLDVDRNSCGDGAHVIQFDWNGDNNQRWLFLRQSDGTYVVRNKASGKVLDVTGGPQALAAGDKIQQWTDLGGMNQRWRIEHAGDGLVRLVAAHSGHVLDVEGVSTSNLARLQQWPWLNGANQKFALTAIVSDVYAPIARSCS